MTVTTTTHANFRGEARAALDFYRDVFDGEQTIITYAMFGAAADHPDADRVVWGEVVAQNGFRIMAFDVPVGRDFDTGVDPFFVSVRGDDPAEIERFWSALCVGGTVVAPLTPSAWSRLYGMVRDKFGLTFVLDVAAPRSA